MLEGWMPKVLIHQATVYCSFIKTEREGFHDTSLLFKCMESPCWPAGCRGWSLHWVAWLCCPGPVSNGNSSRNWPSWWRQTSRHSPVRLYNRSCSWIWNVPGLEGRHRVHFIYPSSHPFIHSSIHPSCTCNVPYLQSDFFFIRPEQQLHRIIH